MALRTRIGYAHVTSTLALIIALGGTGYAAVTLPKNSVGKAQIKKNSVVSAKVKDGSLLAKDFKKGQVPAGPAGPAGAAGPQGPAGPAGPAGPLLDALPSGKTLTGAWATGGQATAANQWVDDESISYQFKVAGTVQRQVRFAGQPATAQCPGTPAAPTAAPGNLCIYVGFWNNVATVNTFSPVDGNASDYTRGAAVYLRSAAVGATEASGTWAVTAP